MKHTMKYDLYTPLSNVVNLDNVDILDFGGSFGNLIRSSNGNILPKNYTCVDVDGDALSVGRKDYPTATWIHLDLYNPMYNPTGNNTIDFPKKYDVIFSFSVFAHTTFEYFLETIETLKKYLTPTGKIYITMVTSSNDIFIKWIIDKRVLDYGKCDEFIDTDSYFYLVDNKIKYTVPLECNHLITVYNENFLSKIGNLLDTTFKQTLIEIK